MIEDTLLTREQIKQGLIDLEGLAQDEYGLTFEEILADENPQRLERITGILIKRPFASSRGRDQNDLVSETGAHTIWTWDIEKLKVGVPEAEEEYELLKNLCKAGPWHEERNQTTGTTWEDFADDVDQERGLFKVMALYLKDRLDKSGKTRTIAEYYNAGETETLKRGLDLVTILAQAGIVTPIVSAVGIPGLAVSLALFVADYGADRLFDKEMDRQGDNYS
jgi:hypothetical protein